VILTKKLKENFFNRALFGITICCILLVLFIAAGLLIKAYPILSSQGVSNILFSDVWHPVQGKFGMFAFIMGTLWVTFAAVIIAIPLSIMTAIYLSEYASFKVTSVAKPLIDLLAGIPSVIYGVWGVIVIVPLVKDYIAPFFGIFTSGYTVLSAGIVLAVMVFPVIIHVTLEVLKTVPLELRDASLSLGATKWQTIKHVVVRKALPGIIAANVLGFTRAFGETMAVLMVAGNVAVLPGSIFDPAYPLPALIANNYGEMMSIPLYDSALLLAAFVLFVVVIIFNVISRYILTKVKRRIA
jgi:phosphate transport system permease protein